MESTVGSRRRRERPVELDGPVGRLFPSRRSRRTRPQDDVGSGGRLDGVQENGDSVEIVASGWNIGPGSAAGSLFFVRHRARCPSASQGPSRTAGRSEREQSHGSRFRSPGGGAAPAPLAVGVPRSGRIRLQRYGVCLGQALSIGTRGLVSGCRSGLAFQGLGSGFSERFPGAGHSKPGLSPLGRASQRWSGGFLAADSWGRGYKRGTEMSPRLMGDKDVPPPNCPGPGSCPEPAS